MSIANIDKLRLEDLDRRAREPITAENRLKAIFEIWWHCVHATQPTLLSCRNHVVDKLGILLADSFIRHAVDLSDNQTMLKDGSVVRL